MATKQITDVPRSGAEDGVNKPLNIICYIVELSLDQHGHVTETVVVDVKSREEKGWQSWDEGRLLEFFASRPELNLSTRKSVPLAATALPIEEPPPPPATSATSIEELPATADTSDESSSSVSEVAFSSGQLAIVPDELVPPSDILGHEQPFQFHLNLAEANEGKCQGRLDYTIEVTAKNMESRDRSKLEEVTDTARSTGVPAKVASSSVREAAEAAAEMYGPTKIENHARVIGEAWKAKLHEQSKIYVKKLTELTRKPQGHGNSEEPEAAGPITLPPIPYPWWNLRVAGPFQPVAPLGPFLPSKMIRHNEPAFMLVAFWCNPAPLPRGPNPSAAQIMSPFRCQLRLETINLSAIANGPDFVPPDFQLGGSIVTVVPVPISPDAFSAPADGKPTLYEMNATANILGPTPGLASFAGFSTFDYDPDTEFPFLFVPGFGPHIYRDSGAHFQIYV